MIYLFNNRQSVLRKPHADNHVSLYCAFFSVNVDIILTLIGYVFTRVHRN